MKKKPVITKQKTKKAVQKANEASAFLLDNKSLLIVAGGGVLAYFVYKRLQNSVEAVTEAFKSEEADHIEVDLTINPKKLTISTEKAKILSKSLLDAFNDTTMGLPSTDEKKIKEVFDTMKTGDDFRLVSKLFGKRKRVGGKTPTTWLDKKFGDKYDLIYWLKAEISPIWDRSLYKQIEQRVKSAELHF